MQDDLNEGKTGVDPQQQAEEPRLAAEREVLLKQRRTRQIGKSSRSSMFKLMALAVIGAAAFLVVAVGPTGALKILGVFNNHAPQTSTVDMEVDRERVEQGHLDFVVPSIPEKVEEKPVDANLAWDQRFKELQDKLLEVERTKRPEISSNEIRGMLAGYNEALMRKLEEERKVMTAENARLREAADKAEEERRRVEEEIKLQAATATEREKIEKMQRKSRSVVIDERSNLATGQPGVPEGELAANPDQNEQFLKSVASSVVQTSVSQKLYDSSRMIVQGTIISAVLETAIDTQLPGNIKAQVMQPVYSFDGSRVLMPSGTILIGQFNHDVDLAQKRVLIAWNRAVTPNGNSIAIGSTGTDTLGRAGTLGNVDNRSGAKFGAAVLISAITAIPSALSSGAGGRSSGSGSGSGSSGTTINVGDQIGSNAGKDVSDQASGILKKYLSLPPIIRVPQGEEIRVFVNRDLVIK